MECAACHKDNEEGARFCGACGTPLVTSVKGGPDRLVGTTVGGRYRIVRQVAQGGMGIVYAAEQQLGGLVREVAVKVLPPEAFRDQGLVSRFFRECTTVAGLEPGARSSTVRGHGVDLGRGDPFAEHAENGCENDDCEDEIGNRPRRHDGCALGERFTLEAPLAVFLGKRLEGLSAGRARDVLVVDESHIAA